MPRCNPTVQSNTTAPGSLWDCFGFPIGYPVGTHTGDSDPLDYPYRAYWMIWNEFFRVPGIQNEMIWSNSSSPADLFTYYPAWRNWTRDYFTSALPWAQRGTAPALPVFGTMSLDSNFAGAWTPTSGTHAPPLEVSVWPSVSLSPTSGEVRQSFVTMDGLNPSGGSISNSSTNNLGLYDAALEANVTGVGSTLSSVDINDMRLAWQT